jgi:tRNA A-37 threonylcarbamoyl transferase component Bud32
MTMPSQSSPPPAVGSRLNGRYRIEDRIGSGGMSTVYRAFDETLEREVAIKIMHSDISSDDAALERFRREARTVAQLSHPHVVMVIDAGEDGGHPYIVFEHVKGETLKDRIRREGPLPIAEAIAYAIEVGRALQAAHERGLVHRDVKPQNVLIDEEGRAKVTDFGIARGLESKQANQLTAAGKVIGTTDYVSPEQAMGQEVSGQSDVYSLGIMLYEMLVGEVPFSGDSHVSVAMKHVREGLPDVRRRRPEVSAALAAVLERATAKDLETRYPTMDQLVRDLEEVLTYESARSGGATGEATAILSQLPASIAGRRSRRRTIGLAVVYVAIAAVVAVVAALLVNGESRQNEPIAPGDLRAIALNESDAHEYDPPPGDGRERGTQGLALDGDPTTAWETERYDSPDLGNLKKGVGLYLDAGRPIVARGMRIVTPKEGWDFEVYVARNGVPAALSGWTLVASGVMDSMRKTIPLDTASQRSRYYLLWITKLTEGATGGSSAAVSEVKLLS